MGEFEPGASEGVGERSRILLKALPYGLVGGVELECEVRGEHHGQVLLILDVRVRNISFLIDGVPLPCAAWTFLQCPVVVVEVVEVLAIPLGGAAGPGAFKARGDGVFRVPLAFSVLPAKALLLDRCSFGFGTNIRAGVVCAVTFAEGVATGDEGEGLFIVHGHATEGLANVAGGADRVGLAIRSLRVYVDKAHLHCGQRMVEIALALIAIAT